MSQAIKTKYLSPTSTKGARVRASCEAGSITLPWRSSMNTESNHDRAAVALCNKLGWNNEYYSDLIRAWLKGVGCVYVFHSDFDVVKLERGNDEKDIL